MRTSELIIASKALIDTPEKWTTAGYARNSNGAIVPVSAKDAVCFCAHGALDKASLANNLPYLDNRVAQTILNAEVRKEKQSHISNLINYNDTHSHEEVMSLFDRAIAQAQFNEDRNDERF